jgi:hypothetical protein
MGAAVIGGGSKGGRRPLDAESGGHDDPVASADSASDRDLRPLLEAEGLLLVRTPSFRLTEDEIDLAGRRWDDGRSKNVSYNPGTGRIDGAVAVPATFERLRGLMARYAAWASDRLAEFFPAYSAEVEIGRTSFRPRSVLETPRSLRKDDRRLHVDAFTSQPVAGRRILRVFSNVDPSGASRDWAVGEGFEDYARRFLPRSRRLLPGEAAVLEAFTLTKSRRTDYDQIMLTMHDAAKSDRAYQRTAPRRLVSFEPGATWVAFTDQSPHAAIAGQCALEQTFYLPIEALHDPQTSPLRILERLCGAQLV